VAGFLLFTRVSLLTWGGGQASLGLMQRETTASGWVTPAEFADAVALGNALPGPIAAQVAAFAALALTTISPLWMILDAAAPGLLHYARRTALVKASAQPPAP
jgi:chromate transport protein ChrA